MIGSERMSRGVNHPYNIGVDGHNRHSIRLSGYDYAQPGAYFVTLCTQCTHGRATLFGDIIDDAMHLTEYGEIAQAYWQAIPRHFPFSKLDAFVIMPNHIHGILWIVDRGQYKAGDASAQPDAPIGTTPNSLGAMIQNFKSVTTRHINRARAMPATPLWQHNYYDNIIRNEQALQRIREYILANPLQWARDEEYPLRSKP